MACTLVCFQKAECFKTFKSLKCLICTPVVFPSFAKVVPFQILLSVQSHSMQVYLGSKDDVTCLSVYKSVLLPSETGVTPGTLRMTLIISFTLKIL